VIGARDTDLAGSTGSFSYLPERVVQVMARGSDR
jgi:hypothetical protein